MGEESGPYNGFDREMVGDVVIEESPL